MTVQAKRSRKETVQILFLIVIFVGGVYGFFFSGSSKPAHQVFTTAPAPAAPAVVHRTPEQRYYSDINAAEDEAQSYASDRRSESYALHVVSNIFPHIPPIVAEQIVNTAYSSQLDGIRDMGVGISKKWVAKQPIPAYYDHPSPD